MPLQPQSSNTLTAPLGLHGKIGDVDMDHYNVQGGSIAIGPPFGATITLLITQLAKIMQRQDASLSLLTAYTAEGLK